MQECVVVTLFRVQDVGWTREVKLFGILSLACNEVTMVKQVCIIGAGPSGLASIKCCLDEGLEPTCFEMGDDIGGLWKYRDEVMEGQGNIYLSLVTNTSKEMMCFSDFPMPAHFPVFMRHTVLFQYFHLYANKFQLTKYIRLKTKVKSVTKQTDFPSSGQWNIMIVDENGKEEKLVFDAVMFCSGLQMNPHLPLKSFPGIEHFRGRYLHSHDYKKPQEFQGQRVLVIGASNSGVDVAVGVSDLASQVYLSTRSGVWIFDPLADNGHPLDMALLSRWFFKKLYWCSWEAKKAEQKLNKRFDHANFGLQCKYGCLSRQGTINNHLPYRIISGSVIVKSNVESFTETGALFEDGTSVENLDAVIFATGYSQNYPTVEADGSLSMDARDRRFIFKNVFLPELSKPTLALIGKVEPIGPTPPVSEIQARWACRVFKGLTSLPDQVCMMEEVKKNEISWEKLSQNGQRHPYEVSFIDYMDDVANQIGVKPNLLRLSLRDPALACSVFFGPCTPYQYRLQGPGRWEEAAQAIRTQWDRTLTPTRTRVLPHSETTTNRRATTDFFFKFAFLVLLAGLGVLYYL
uniref:flavin-containing monooxygenase 5-like isoform X1 n=2 Tax=Myxine glutinosa TaxID=7769 RepID=UPI00358FF602